LQGDSQKRQSSIFGPGVPVMPVNPLDRPRTFQYKPGINLVIIPRYGYGLTDFGTLRNLAAACKEIRLNIELVKREVRSLEWKIVAQQENDKRDYSKDVDEVQAFLDEPDGNQMDFDSFINAALEEALVTDALTIYPSMSGGELASLDLVDGTTIRPVLDYRGKIAKPPMPGYMQVLYGMPAGSWTTDELIYRPINASVNSPYGTSPIEFIMLAVNLALRRETYHVGYYTEGNVPESIVGLPATWSQKQIDDWQQYWDALLSGNVKQQRKMHFFPRDGSGGMPVYEFRRDNVDMTAQDEWLMKVACWAFGNSPQEFGLTSGAGLGGAGYAGAMADVHSRSMIGPVTQYLQRILTKIIHKQMRKPWLKFQWIGLDPTEDTLKQAQVDQINMDMGVYDVGYIQERDGIPQEHRPSGPPQAGTGDMLDLPYGSAEGVPTLEDGSVAKFFRQQGDWENYTENTFTSGAGVPTKLTGIFRGA
jgi:hypothetical protein